MRTGIKYKICNCYYCNNTFNCNSIQNDKPIKDLHADNSLASFATNGISSTRCITTKHDKRFLSILLKITQFKKNHKINKTDLRAITYSVIIVTSYSRKSIIFSMSVLSQEVTNSKASFHSGDTSRNLKNFGSFLVGL